MEATHVLRLLLFVVFLCKPSACKQHEAYVDVVVSDCRDFRPEMLHQVAESKTLFGGFTAGSLKHRAFIYHKCGELAEWKDFKSNDERRWRVHRANLPNFGFEAHTYLHHMFTHYDDLAEITMFLQGNPLVHAANLLTAPINFSLPMTWLVTHDKSKWEELNSNIRNSWSDEAGARNADPDHESGESDDWNEAAFLGGSSGLDTCYKCRTHGTNEQSLKLKPSAWKARGKVGVSSVQKWLHARKKAYPWACSALGDIEDFIKSFWPQFSLAQKRCFHAPQTAQFALTASAIQQYPKVMLENAINLLTPDVGLQTFIRQQNQRGGVCNTVMGNCDLPGDVGAHPDKWAEYDKIRPGVIDSCAPSCKEHVDSLRGRMLALQLPWRTDKGSWERPRSVNQTHCEASFATATLFEQSWQLLFSGPTDDGCIKDWRAAMPLRAHAALSEPELPGDKSRAPNDVN